MRLEEEKKIKKSPIVVFGGGFILFCIVIAIVYLVKGTQAGKGDTIGKPIETKEAFKAEIKVHNEKIVILNWGTQKWEVHPMYKGIGFIINGRFRYIAKGPINPKRVIQIHFHQFVSFLRTDKDYTFSEAHQLLRTFAIATKDAVMGYKYDDFKKKFYLDKIGVSQRWERRVREQTDKWLMEQTEK